MRAALVIALKDLRQRLRDRTAIIVAVIAPFGLAAIFSTLIGGASGRGGAAPTDSRYFVRWSASWRVTAWSR